MNKTRAMTLTSHCSFTSSGKDYYRGIFNEVFKNAKHKYLRNSGLSYPDNDNLIRVVYYHYPLSNR